MLCSKSIASMYGTKLLKLRMMTKVRKNKDPKDPPKQLSTEPHCNDAPLSFIAAVAVRRGKDNYNACLSIFTASYAYYKSRFNIILENKLLAKSAAFIDCIYIYIYNITLKVIIKLIFIYKLFKFKLYYIKL